MFLKIGELARRTGLTVRTLHHYDAIGLLCPSARSDAGYRLYNRRDIERLHRIQALRRLDLSLADIAGLLEGGSADLKTVIEQQIAALDRQAARTIALRDRLRLMLAKVNKRQEPDLSDWLVTLEMMSMYDKHFTREEVESLCRFDASLMDELAALVIAVRALMDRGAPPDCDEAQALARPWLVLSLQHMNGDARLMLKLEAMHRNDPGAQALTGVDSAMMDYMTQASAEFRLRLYARHLAPEEVARAREGYFRHYRHWPELFARLRQLREDAADPCGPEAQDLYRRWVRLFQDSWGSDPAMREKIVRINSAEPDILFGSGLDAGSLEFLARAAAHMNAQQPENKS